MRSANYRNAWGVFRDRRPELYGPMLLDARIGRAASAFDSI